MKLKNQRTGREGLRYQYSRFTEAAERGDDVYVTRCLRLRDVARKRFAAENGTAGWLAASFARRVSIDDLGLAARRGCRSLAGPARNRRGHRAGAGDGTRSTNGPAPGAGNFAVYPAAADRTGRAAAILESRQRGS